MTVNEKIKIIVDGIPLQSGVYKFFDKDGRLLYIGKATNLRSRVQSYFRESTNLSVAKRQMVQQIDDIQITVVDNAQEALLLETTLIKKYKPRYNVVMKDDKNFQYIHITDDVYPRIETVRSLPMRGRNGEYFGPYTSGFAVKETLRLLHSLFRYCLQPPLMKKGKIVYPQRPCLEFHMGRCIGPCANAVTPEEYRLLISQVGSFLKGEYEVIRSDIERLREAAADAEEYERAARFRDQVRGIDRMMEEQKVVSTNRQNADFLSLVRDEHDAEIAAVNVFIVRQGKLTHQEVFFLSHTKNMSDEDVIDAFTSQYYSQTVTVPPAIYKSTEDRRGRNRKLLQMGKKNAAEALGRRRASFEKNEVRAEKGLKEIAQVLGKKPEELVRIEIYDISNFQGKFSVGSMVVFINGRSESSQYRKFKIKTVEGPNDFASLQEVMNRRLRHIDRKSAKGVKDPWPRPDLIVIDGGKGQLSAAASIFDLVDIDIPIISLAKREEEIFVPGSSTPLILEKGSEGYHLMQRMRDEAHRFAIGFYRKRHLKGLI